MKYLAAIWKMTLEFVAYSAFFISWVVGIALAETFAGKIAGLFFFPYALLLTAQMVLRHFGLKQ